MYKYISTILTFIIIINSFITISFCEDKKIEKDKGKLKIHPMILDTKSIKWKLDSDKDGLLDAEEEVMGTDINNIDSDNDKLNDKFEIEMGLDPTKEDTNNNNIIDSDEDSDNDGLTNFKEQNYKTDPTNKDSDYDNISDYDEINIYNTNPNKEDSDNDNISDYDEIKLKTNPNKLDTNSNGIKDGDENYKINIDTDEFKLNENIKIHVLGNIKGKHIDDIYITSTKNTHKFITDTMPGYVGDSYKIGIEGENTNQELELIFDINSDTIRTNQNLALYEYNDKDNTLTKVIKNIYKINSNKIKATVKINDYKEYVILDEDLYNEAWNIDIMDYIKNANEFVNDNDKDGIPNYFEKNIRINNGEILDLDPNNFDSDNDGLSDGYEITGKKNPTIKDFYKKYNIYKKYFDYITRPDLKDSDNDGLNDKEDKNPTSYDINTKMLLESADLSYINEELDKNTKVKDINHILYKDLTTKNALISDFVILNHRKGSTFLNGRGFSAIAMKKDDKLIVSYTGSNDKLDWIANFSMLFLPHYQQSMGLIFIDNILKNNKEINEVYISGHSLGGLITQYTTNKMVSSSKYKYLDKINSVTFNSAPFTSPNHVNNMPGPAVVNLSSGLNSMVNNSFEIWNIVDDGKLAENMKHLVINNDILYYGLGARYLGSNPNLYNQGHKRPLLENSKAHDIDNFYKEYIY